MVRTYFGIIASYFKKRIIRWEKKLTFSKRQEFSFITVFLTGLLLLTQLVSQDFRYPFVMLLAICTFTLSAFGLREDLKGIEWITLLILPTFYSTAVGLFYFLLPVRWLTRIPVAVLYAIGLYAVLLTENIYNVAANRTIALLRPAYSIGFLITFVTYFFLIQTILAFRFSALTNTFLVALVSFCMIFQSLWSMELTDEVSRRVKAVTVALTVVLAQLTWIMALWPAPTTIQAIFIASTFYSTVGMGQQYVVDKLYKKTIIEFFFVCAIVFFILLLSTHWRRS